MHSEAQARQEALRLHTQAVEEYNVGRPARARATLMRALRALERDNRQGFESERQTLAARIWISIALNDSELHGLAAGLRSWDKAALLAKGVGDPAIDVLLHCQRGLIDLRGGQLAHAMTAFDTALSLIEYALPRDQFSIRLNRATLSLHRGDLAGARADLIAAAAIANKAGLGVGVFKALHNLGYLEFLAGDIPLALERMADAARADLGQEWGVALLDRARVLAEAGLELEADHTLAIAETIFRHDRLAQDLAETELERARCALIGGDVAAGRRFAARARDRFRRRGNDRWRRSAELVLLQADLAAGRPSARLVEHALRLQGELNGQGLRLPARTAGLIAAEDCLLGGDTEAAAAVVGALGGLRRGDPIIARLHARYVQARLDSARGDERRASRQVRAGLDDLSAYQASFGSIDLQTASAIHGRKLAEFGLSVALHGERAAEVFAAAERARAVSTRLPVVRPPKDQEAAEMLAELRQVVESLRAVTQDVTASAPLLRRRRELERAITARRWTLAGAGEARRIARVSEVRAAVAEADTTMVVFVEVGGTLHAVVAGAERLRLLELGPSAGVAENVRRVRADLDVLAQPRLPGGLSAAVRSSFERSAAELDRALLAPLHLNGQRLIVVSTGILGQLPWGTLPSLRGVPVVVAPSATAWLAAMQTPARRRKRQIFAVAGPDLVRANHEVAGVAAAWGTVVTHMGEAAARLAVAKAMARGSVVHVAAHGVHQTENPLFSSLRLADGPMFAHEMDQTARTPEHVVLSACELGLATVRPGDEALGLTSVLLHLGTRSVVAGVARVGDDLAAETMIEYHRRLANGQDSAAALADAASAASAPIPFVCFGASWRRRPN